MTTLGKALDDVWHAPDSARVAASRCVDQLSDAERLKAIAFDVWAYTGLPIESYADLGNGRLRFFASGTGTLLDVDVLGQQQPAGLGDAAASLIEYVDLGLEVSVVSGLHPGAQPRLRRSLADTLLALQLARDHVDSALYLPPDMRFRRIEAFAEESNTPLAMFKRMATYIHRWFPL